jgi:VWFA-related protein
MMRSCCGSQRISAIAGSLALSGKTAVVALLRVKAGVTSNHWIECGLLACLLVIQPQGIAQAPPTTSPGYSMKVTVNEVAINFHATDAQGLPVLDLKPSEVDIFDNQHGPGQIVSMQLLRNRSIRAALILDTSGSVSSQITRYNAEAQQAVQTLLVQTADQGIAVAFDRSRRVVQSWTNQKENLLKSIADIGPNTHNRIDGSSVYDTLFNTCFFDFGEGASPATANVIVLFSDGIDTASHMTAQAATERCRQSHTSVYVFRSASSAGSSSLGASALQQLTEQTGGRLFYADDPEGAIQADLETLRADLRSQYFLLYRPKILPRDGAFHKIVLVGPHRVAQIIGASGFYGPSP